MNISELCGNGGLVDFAIGRWGNSLMITSVFSGNYNALQSAKIWEEEEVMEVW